MRRGLIFADGCFRVCSKATLAVVLLRTFVSVGRRKQADCVPQNGKFSLVKLALLLAAELFFGFTALA